MCTMAFKAELQRGSENIKWGRVTLSMPILYQDMLANHLLASASHGQFLHQISSAKVHSPLNMEEIFKMAGVMWHRRALLTQ